MSFSFFYICKIHSLGSGLCSAQDADLVTYSSVEEIAILIFPNLSVPNQQSLKGEGQRQHHKAAKSDQLMAENSLQLCVLWPEEEEEEEVQLQKNEKN